MTPYDDTKGAMMTRMTLRLPDELLAVVRQRVGERGANGLVVQLLETWAGMTPSEATLTPTPMTPSTPDDTKAARHSLVADLIAQASAKHQPEAVEETPTGISYGCAHCGEGPTHAVRKYGQRLQVCSRCDPPR